MDKSEAFGTSVEELRRRLDLAGDVATAFFTGSMVEGFANSSSDLDVIVVREGGGDPVLGTDVAVSGDDGVPAIGIHFEDDVRIDEEVWSASTLEDLIESLPRERSFGKIAMGESLAYSDYELDVLHGIRCGRLLSGRSYFGTLREQLERRDLPALLVRRALVRYTVDAEDAGGAVESGDYESAFLMSGAALDAATDALIASKGETNPKAKWRIKKLRRLGLDDEVEAFWDACRLPSNSKEDLASVAKRRLRLATKWSITAQRVVSSN